MIKTWFLPNLLTESGVQTVRKCIKQPCFYTRSKNLTLCKNGMFSYMVELNDPGSFVVGYSNYETVQMNVEGRLSQQMVRNDSLFVTIFDCFSPLFKLRK